MWYIALALILIFIFAVLILYGKTRLPRATDIPFIPRQKGLNSSMYPGDTVPATVNAGAWS